MTSRVRRVRGGRSGRSRRGIMTLGLAVGLAAGALAGCAGDPARPGEVTAGSLFRSYVALGDGATAGFQSAGWNDSTQRAAYPALLARQAGAPYAYPGYVMPGCPPPLVAPRTDYLREARVGSAERQEQNCRFVDPAATTAPLNNVAAPFASLTGVLTAPMWPSGEPYLNGKSQVARALDAAPTLVSIWAGLDDLLGHAHRGELGPAQTWAYVLPGLRAPDAFASSYGAIPAALRAARPGLEGVLIGLPDPQLLPVFFPAAALFDPAYFAALERATGRDPASADRYYAAPLVVDASCGTAAAPAPALISFDLVLQIDRYRDETYGSEGAGPFHEGHPPVIACEPGRVPPSTHNAEYVGRAYVLDAAERAALANLVAAYNEAIRGQAAAAGWAYYDPNPLLKTLRERGDIPGRPDFSDLPRAFGAYVSLDGVRPAPPLHRLLARDLLAAINAHYGTTVPAPPAQ